MLQIDQSLNHQRLKRLYSQNDLFTSLIKLENKLTPESTECESRINATSVSSETDESIDPFSNLPENWTTFDFHRKKSCILSNIYSTCVTKAINHLEGLQISIEKWLDNIDKSQNGSDSTSNSPNQLLNYINKKSSLKKMSNNKQQLRFSEEISFHNSDSPLSIVGKGAELYEEDKTEMIIVENKPPVEDLKAGGVLEEILILLARLEFDRRRTEQQLQKEHENLAVLKSCIENMALKRAVEIPAKVQHEHDTCISDITEINWHISFNTKAERKLLRKVEIEERLYQQLEEQITTIKKNTPLIEEKIKSEMLIIEKIIAAQADVDVFVHKSMEKLTQTQEKSQSSYNKANKEREAIQADLASCKRELNRAKKRLQDAEEASKENMATIEECSKKLEENRAQERIETLKRDNLRELNDNLNTKNKNINVEIYRVGKEIEKTTEENETKQKVIDEMNAKFNEELDKLTETLNKKIEKMEKVLKKIQEKEVDLDEMIRDMSSMQNKIEKEERNRLRLLDERDKTEEELRNVSGEYEIAIKLNENTQNEFERETRRLDLKEESLKKQISDFRKQIGDERQQLSIIISRMNGEAEDFAHAQIQAEQKRIHFERKKIELDKNFENLTQRVNEIETKKHLLDDRVKLLSEKLDETLKKHHDLETSLTSKIEKLKPEHEKSLNEYTINKNKLEFMKSHTIEMNTKIAEMTESKKFMVKTIEKTLDDISHLELEYAELCVRSDSSEKLDHDNKVSLEQVMDRIKTNELNHKNNMNIRNEYLSRINNQLDNYLSLNKELASRYRYLKHVLYNRKLDLMQKIEFKISTFSSIKDERQLISLQQRMHDALHDYYNFKSKNSEKNYFELKQERDDIGSEIYSLEILLYQSIDHISKFLHNQMDFSRIRQEAMQKVHKEELIEKQEIEAQKMKQLSMNNITNSKKSSKKQASLALKTENKSIKTINLDTIKAV